MPPLLASPIGCLWQLPTLCAGFCGSHSNGPSLAIQCIGSLDTPLGLPKVSGVNDDHLLTVGALSVPTRGNAPTASGNTGTPLWAPQAPPSLSLCRLATYTPQFDTLNCPVPCLLDTCNAPVHCLRGSRAPQFTGFTSVQHLLTQEKHLSEKVEHEAMAEQTRDITQRFTAKLQAEIRRLRPAWAAGTIPPHGEVSAGVRAEPCQQHRAGLTQPLGCPRTPLSAWSSSCQGWM
ncbi:uncharacterized protein LOC123358295 isoform X5 [Mauremys mutica]|uniref:uncharacterized protein LOC123358295 isoform X5 n=1 Tax=Mauremys mutica TaxID=74926 RepID=UPI001D156088|nr:uncharacterized protein LOC123358295 isoform X5 [Mauremys mutica]